MLHIALLMNDTPCIQKPLETERGLSLLINYDNIRILFDTGYDDKFISNAHMMGYSLDKLDAVILSHSHFDHVAGYNVLLERGMAPASLFLGKNFFDTKYIRQGAIYTNLASSLNKEDIKKQGIIIKQIENQVKLANDLYLVSCSLKTPYYAETPDNNIRLSNRNFVKDNFDDEIALVISTRDGMVIVTGSCHHSILNVIETVKDSFHRPIAAIIGGMTIANTPEEYAYLRQNDIKLIGVCNNDATIKYNASSKLNISRISVGDEFFFN